MIAGPVIDAIGNKVILVVSSALVAAAMVGFAYAHSYATVAGPAVLLGFGGGGMHGYSSLEGSFLGGCLFTGRTTGTAIANLLR